MGFFNRGPFFHHDRCLLFWSPWCPYPDRTTLFAFLLRSALWDLDLDTHFLKVPSFLRITHARGFPLMLYRFAIFITLFLMQTLFAQTLSVLSLTVTRAGILNVPSSFFLIPILAYPKTDFVSPLKYRNQWIYLNLHFTSTTNFRDISKLTLQTLQKIMSPNSVSGLMKMLLHFGHSTWNFIQILRLLAIYAFFKERFNMFWVNVYQWSFAGSRAPKLVGGFLTFAYNYQPRLFRGGPQSGFRTQTLTFQTVEGEAFILT